MNFVEFLLKNLSPSFPSRIKFNGLSFLKRFATKLFLFWISNSWKPSLSMKSILLFFSLFGCPTFWTLFLTAYSRISCLSWLTSLAWKSIWSAPSYSGLGVRMLFLNAGMETNKDEWHVISRFQSKYHKSQQIKKKALSLKHLA